ncbi:cardiolipin synthase [Bacillus sp. ISL-40]|uniref:cardiolipin synthase n=1 Tax=unclassified Bacillus (in: firmicutes) TaxID=185979 RepID=UPI001BE6EE49|nr:MULTISPECIES: cardiolipin synthase [unclassified Bacillus (in: firmicutes)]MBT2699058.1 cardiolipin synthase [Bacillus sp. ISL-40]MBT2723730.1 cardiolipin synthase [Bacillus sp. ISL-46]MBT2739439.1 cardiolipin synthase [Bacillus sp. ISL-77]
MTFALFSSVVLFFIILWLVLDFILGKRKHLSIVSRRETAIIHGNFDIFTHGKKLFADYFHELRNAKKHIHVLFYIVKDDAISQEFFSILKEKARAGVEVRLLIDRLGSWKVKKAAVKALQKAGVRFAFSNTIKLPFLFYSSQIRNHRKVTIIDGEIGYLGGFNVGKEYIDEEPSLGIWRDYHLKITGQSVNFLQSEFLFDWHEYAGEDIMGNPAYFPTLADGPVRHQFVPTEANQLEQNYLRLIQKATHSMIIGTPYFIPCPKILAELLEAIKRGVQLSIIVPYTADHLLVQEASFRYLRKLIRAGAAVYQYKKGFYHAKTIVIDDKLCDIGTANFDKRSMYLNKEINCYIYDPAFIERLMDILKKDIDDSEPLTLAELNKPNPVRTIKEGIAAAVSYFL